MDIYSRVEARIADLDKRKQAHCLTCRQATVLPGGEILDAGPRVKCAAGHWRTFLLADLARGLRKGLCTNGQCPDWQESL